MVDFAVEEGGNVDEELEKMFIEAGEGKLAVITEQLALEWNLYSFVDCYPNLYVTQDPSVLMALPYFLLLNPRFPRRLTRILNAM